MTRQQYGIPSVVAQTSFCVETGDGVPKCRLFSQGIASTKMLQKPRMASVSALICRGQACRQSNEKCLVNRDQERSTPMYPVSFLQRRSHRKSLKTLSPPGEESEGGYRIEYNRRGVATCFRSPPQELNAIWPKTTALVS